MKIVWTHFGDSSRNLWPTDIWFNEATANGYRVQPIYKKRVYQMTHYFVQPQYISELDYYGIFAILNTRITELYWGSIKTE